MSQRSDITNYKKKLISNDTKQRNYNGTRRVSFAPEQTNRYNTQTRSKYSPSRSTSDRVNCYKCGQMGHYAKSWPSDSSIKIKDNVPAMSVAFKAKSAHIEEFNINQREVDQPKVVGYCLVDSNPVKCQVDTGCDVTLLESSVISQNDSVTRIKPFQSTLRYANDSTTNALIPKKKYLLHTQPIIEDLKSVVDSASPLNLYSAQQVSIEEDLDIETAPEFLKNKCEGFVVNSLKDLTQTEAISHVIHVTDATPIRQKVRKIPFNKRNEVKKMLDEMLAAKLIQPSVSAWSSPLCFGWQT
ncbi:unnamed protein product [Brachionus calyciflorus]|uniref:CCHC-type domain-containing protein n=1 Tax=Brachionus calyciflorus TaxID=104777 RepID=A0A814FVC4_9BILA|nr:unnamed protein product [Brachionus calyciflorus]